MKKDNKDIIQTRKQLFNFLQSQMQNSYDNLNESQKLNKENTLVKSYIIEVDLPENPNSDTINDFIQKTFQPPGVEKSALIVSAKDEEGLFELSYNFDGSQTSLFIDTITNQRFWLVFSVSGVRKVEGWLHYLLQSQPQFDFVWLWPTMLEKIQEKGQAKGFGLDYDFRKFVDEDDDDATTYLKMQLWGGTDSKELYNILKTSTFSNKVVLSKVRLKAWADYENKELFALEDIKYTGKFTTRGTDFNTHLSLLTYVREEYERKVIDIEKNYSLKWLEKETKNLSLEGFAIHFIPKGFEIPVENFSKKVLDGTEPFRLVGLPRMISKNTVISDVVDLHTGGELSMEIYPDLISVYLPEKTCGNTIVRLFTNLQHYFNIGFNVEADNGDLLF